MTESLAEINSAPAVSEPKVYSRLAPDLRGKGVHIVLISRIAPYETFDAVDSNAEAVRIAGRIYTEFGKLLPLHENGLASGGMIEVRMHPKIVTESGLFNWYILTLKDVHSLTDTITSPETGEELHVSTAIDTIVKRISSDEERTNTEFAITSEWFILDDENWDQHLGALRARMEEHTQMSQSAQTALRSTGRTSAQPSMRTTGQVRAPSGSTVTQETLDDFFA